MCSNKNFNSPTRVDLQKEVTGTLKVKKQRHRNVSKRRTPSDHCRKQRRVEADELFNNYNS